MILIDSGYPKFEELEGKLKENMIKSAFERGFPGLLACFTGRTSGDRARGSGALAETFSGGDFRVYMPVQRHTGQVLNVTGHTPEGQVADAVVTSERGLLLGVRVADCVPILLYDPQRPSVGAVHAGWRGTALAILSRTIDRMVAEFGANPEEIRMAVGPSIRGCCYNVGPEVVDGISRTVRGDGWMTVKGNAVHVDLAVANRLQALEAGIVESNIRVVPDCTSCRREAYFSYRKEGPDAGRQAAFIGLHHPHTGVQGG